MLIKKETKERIMTMIYGCKNDEKWLSYKVD